MDTFILNEKDLNDDEVNKVIRNKRNQDISMVVDITLDVTLLVKGYVDNENTKVTTI